MSYPEYPKNRLIVGDADSGVNIDLTVKFGMVLLDGYGINFLCNRCNRY